MTACSRRLATRILEIDRGQLFDWSCDYNTFLQRKEAALAAQEKQDALFDKRLAEEEVWIRQSNQSSTHPKRRASAGVGRHASARRERRADTGRVALRVEEGQRSGNLVAAVKDISFSYGPILIVPRFSTLVMRGDKIGRRRSEWSGQDDFASHSAWGSWNPIRVACGWVRICRLPTSISCVVSWMEKQPCSRMSEKGMIPCRSPGRRGTYGLLAGIPLHARTCSHAGEIPFGWRTKPSAAGARLFAKPANVIVLDEPTNDLDTETLELLEQRLVEFNGTVLLVSHDRTFLNNIVTSTIVFEEGQLARVRWWVRRLAACPAARGGASWCRPQAGGSKERSAEDQR